MHDLCLGGPVVDERRPNATHEGPCFDGVYGCHVCWNHANDGRGTVNECEWCHTNDVHTRIVRAWDEPVLYAICADCEKRQNDELHQMAVEDADDDGGGYHDCDVDSDDPLPPLNVMVTGGRNYADREHVFRVLDRIHDHDEIGHIIHGASGWNADKPATMTERRLQGADRWADEWARERGVRCTRKPASWTTLGPGGGPRRNAEMVAMKPHRVVVFPGGSGTAGARRLAENAGLTVIREDVR